MAVVPLIFSSNNYFVPYLSVMLASTMEHSSSDKHYEIIILHREISKEYQDILAEQLSEKPNFSLRLIDVSEQVASYSFYTENRTFFTAEAYYRLLAPFILTEYDRAIYMDGDMVALRDVAELMNTDMSNALVAAVRDFCGLADVYDPRTERRKYIESTLHLKNCHDYYISGLLVMNLKVFRESFSLGEMMRLAASRDWEYHDQDVLNILTEGRTKLLDPRWNVLQDYGTHHYLPEALYREWKATTKNPYIVHYGGVLKPWRMPRVPRGRYFRRYAKLSPFRDEIQARKRREWKTDRRYRLSCVLQLLFPLGGRSREIVKKFTRPLWQRIKVKLK